MSALEKLGYLVTPVDVNHDIAGVLKSLRPDVAFNALHGRFGEDGCIQGILEVLEIPYTHSGVLASALAMDKPMAKKVFAAEGLRVAEGEVLTREEWLLGRGPRAPYVVKPLNEGSSVGVKVILEGDNASWSDDEWPEHRQALVERYIPGREVQVAVLGGKALGAIEIRPRGRFYDYTAKYTDGMAEHLMPAPIHPDAYAEVMRLAERAHDALGCRGLTRSDFRYDIANGEPGTFYILEVNTQPGMTPLSLSPEIAAHAGITYSELCDRLVREARCSG